MYKDFNFNFADLVFDFVMIHFNIRIFEVLFSSDGYLGKFIYF